MVCELSEAFPALSYVRFQHNYAPTVQILFLSKSIHKKRNSQNPFKLKLKQIKQNFSQFMSFPVHFMDFIYVFKAHKQKVAILFDC